MNKDLNMLAQSLDKNNSLKAQDIYNETGVKSIDTVRFQSNEINNSRHQLNDENSLSPEN